MRNTFVTILSPALLVHLVETSLECGHRNCVHLVTAAIAGQADELDDPCLFAIATRIITRLHAGGLPPFVELEWRDALSAIRRCLNFDELSSASPQ